MIGWQGVTQDKWWELGRDVVIAILIMVVAHFAAKAVKWAVAKSVDRIPFFPRREQVAGVSAQPPTRIGERVGEVAYWVVWLLGLMVVLNGSMLKFGGVVDLSPVVTPLQNLVNQIVIYVPNVIGAALIFFIGFALATIVRRMVEAAVQAFDLDRRLVDAGLTHAPRGPGLSRILGLLVFTLIIIPVATAALNALHITAISEPAVRMMDQILAAIPFVIGAALIVFIAYLIGRWVGLLTEEGLQTLGFDEAIRRIGAAEPIRNGMQRAADDSAKAEAGAFPPSRIVGIAVLVGIVLFASVQAAQVMGFAAMSQMLGEVLSLATRVLFGAVIIAVGVLIANVLAAAASRKDRASSEVMAVFVRWGVIALSAAVGLRFMGLANDIIVVSFALILGAVAVAVAISFGIGGRDAAKRLLDRWTSGT